MLKFLYSFFLVIIYIPYSIVIFFRVFLNKEDKIKFKEKIIVNKVNRPNGFLFWFHVASLGEFNSILPIISHYSKKDTKSRDRLSVQISTQKYNKWLGSKNKK